MTKHPSIHALLVFLTLTGASWSALAAPPVPLAQSLSGEAKGEYESGRSLFDIGDQKAALLKFKHAFVLSSDPRLLWNMAACEKEMHHYRRAVVLVESYLKESDARITAETRTNATASLNALRALTSQLTFVGVPDGAKIFVDDELVGTAPHGTTVTVDIGSHKLRVEHADYDGFETNVDGITGGGTNTVPVTMKTHATARLDVVAGKDATITLDGAVVGTASWQGNVAPGSHHLHVTAAGKVPYDLDLDLAPRATRTLQVTLHGDSKRSVWPWIVGGALVAGGAAVGGYYLFKPKDHTESPSPEGGLGTVVLPAGVRFR